MCSQPGCDQGPHARGMCREHYGEWYNASRRKTARPNDCVRCGGPLGPERNANSRYCTPACAKAGERERARAKGYKRPTYEMACGNCDRIFRGIKAPPARAGDARYCSDQCQAEAKAWRYRTVFSEPIRWACRIDSREWYLVRRVHWRKPKAPPLPPSGPCCPVVKHKKRWWVGGPCADCGREFTGFSDAPSHLPAYCSTRCAKRNGKHRRRVRLETAHIEIVHRIKVFERDKWICQLCGDPVERDEECPHPLAPTLDHIQPLALGGDHSYANTQLAHFICNSRKGARIEGEQLALAA